ncbi:MAG: LysR family transcriptional regulator [Oscillatoriales cyanobacterium C42_A2020_001]|nr:LysR family transcriptional regulator [Leptolyngbyaceae cyanobacterium C42_A2020_001]
MELQQLSRFELRQICYFVALVQAENNFTVAAQRLGIKQPPLTQRIQALEELLSAGQIASTVKLFDRSTRPIRLTAAGQVFLEEVQQALLHLDRAIVRSQQASQGQIGHLVVGMTNFIANSLLPDIVQQFQQRFPNVTLEMWEVTVEQRWHMLKQRQVDVIFEQAENFDHIDQALMFQPILQEHFVLVAAAQHRFAMQDQVSLKDLQTEKIILPPVEIFPFYQKVITLCQDAGFEPTILKNVVATGAVTLLSLVAAGLGVSILPNHVESLQRKGVIYRPLAATVPLTRQVAVVWRQNDSSIVLHQFLQVIQEITNSSL